MVKKLQKFGFSYVMISILLIASVSAVSGLAYLKAPEAGPGEVGIVQINGSSGVEIWIENQSAGLIPSSGVLVIPAVRGGTRQVQVLRGDGIPQEQYEVEVFVNETAVLEISPESIYGSLEITSNPPNVKMYLDTTYAGVTPYSHDRVIASGHKVILQMDGYQEWTGDVVIRPGEKTTVSAVLEREIPQTGEPASSTPGFTMVLAILACAVVIACLPGKKN